MGVGLCTGAGATRGTEWAWLCPTCSLGPITRGGGGRGTARPQPVHHVPQETAQGSRSWLRFAAGAEREENVAGHPGQAARPAQRCPPAGQAGEGLLQGAVGAHRHTPPRVCGRGGQPGRWRCVISSHPATRQQGADPRCPWTPECEEKARGAARKSLCPMSRCLGPACVWNLAHAPASLTSVTCVVAYGGNRAQQCW